MSKRTPQQSLIAGALAGTAGIFITKALGLVCSMAFHSMAGDQLIYYTYTGEIYQFLLDISLSGIPSAIAATVAKYAARDDYETVFRVRKIALLMMEFIGGILFFALMLNVDWFVSHWYSGRDPEFMAKMAACLRIMSAALVLVPVLSSFRGFYQGLKEMKLYSFTLVLEQIIRVSVILVCGFIAVYVLDADRIWAVYAAVAAMGISAGGTVLYYLYADRKYLPAYKEMAKETKEENRSSLSTKRLAVDLFLFALPFLIGAILDHGTTLIQQYFLPRAFLASGYTQAQSDLIYSIMNYDAAKISAIPCVIGSGVSIAVIPHISSCVASGDREGMKRSIDQSFMSSGYFTVPLIGLMILFAREVYFVMFGGNALDLAQEIMIGSLVRSFVWIFQLIANTILVSMNLRRQSILNNMIQLAVIFAFLNPVVSAFGYRGYYVFITLVYLLIIVLDDLAAYRNYRIHFLSFAGMLGKQLLCAVPMALVVIAFHALPLDVLSLGRAWTFVICMAVGIAAGIVYIECTIRLHIPEKVFGMKDASIRSILKRIRVRHTEEKI